MLITWDVDQILKILGSLVILQTSYRNLEQARKDVFCEDQDRLL